MYSYTRCHVTNMVFLITDSRYNRKQSNKIPSQKKKDEEKKKQAPSQITQKIRKKKN